MQNLLVTFDAANHTQADIARLESEIWKGLKLSGELDRTQRDGKWVLHFICEKNLKEEQLKKIKALEGAQEVRLRDLLEGSRSKRKAKDGEGEEDGADEFSLPEAEAEED